MKRYEDKAWAESMRLHVDYNSMMSEFVGENGINVSDITSLGDNIARAVSNMEKKRAEMPWRDLPKTQVANIADINQTAEYIRENYEYFVVLGIGGSALGPIAVNHALSCARYNDMPDEKRNGPKFFVEDNVDPERIASLFDVIDIEKTMFNVITKSGNTSETIAQMLLVVDLLQKQFGDGWSSHIVATTDAKNGSLRKIADTYGIKTFVVPDGVGGRFSELCPVGLLSASVCGIDIEELLAGAAYMDEICSSTANIMKNPAFISAVLEVIAMKKGLNVSILMPYSDALKYIADWYAQLWAESLGKRYDKEGNEVFAGQTPVRAVGATDQHSQMQLYREGPNDKVVTFLAVNNYRSIVNIPHVDMFEEIKDISFLSGHTFNELINYERYSAEYALLKSGRMSKNIILEEINPFTIGQLLCLLELQTAFAGELLNINAFDQPGVEDGKKATYALLNREGYEAKREELESKPKKKDEYIA